MMVVIKHKKFQLDQNAVRNEVKFSQLENQIVDRFLSDDTVYLMLLKFFDYDLYIRNQHKILN